MRTLVLVAVVGCSHSMATGGDDAAPPADPKGWTIAIDTSALDRYVQPDTLTSWTVAGTATASDGLASVSVAGTDLGSASAFSTTVTVAPGLTRVPIVAADLAGHTRKGDRTLLAARLLPETPANPNAASLVLTNAILAAMSSGLAASRHRRRRRADPRRSPTCRGLAVHDVADLAARRTGRRSR